MQCIPGIKRSVVIIMSVILLATTLTCCTKTNIEFGDDALSADPNITYLDTLNVSIGTLQLDSFVTAGSKIFVTGTHKDSVFGDYTAGAYIELGIPATNTLKDCSCTYDSIVFQTRPTGGYLGDTTFPFTLSVNQLSQRISTDYGSIGFNTSYFPYNSQPLASRQVVIRPGRKDLISMRLNDDLGLDLFNKLKTNSDTLTDNDKFLNYFKGLYLSGSSSSGNSVFNFGLANPDSNTSVMRLYYKQNDIINTSKYIDFTIADSTHQFNAFTYNRTGTGLAAFTPKKTQILDNTITGNIAYMHYNGGLYPRITFPTLLSIKQLHPYIKVLKAELEVIPANGYSGANPLYILPQATDTRITDENNTVQGILSSGVLTLDQLYNKDTKYTYDVTQYVTSILNTGQFSTQAILIAPSGNVEETDNRLIINTATKEPSVKLKLYVLGL